MSPMLNKQLGIKHVVSTQQKKHVRFVGYRWEKWKCMQVWTTENILGLLSISENKKSSSESWIRVS